MHEKALLPSGVLSKLNDMGVHLESMHNKENKTKRYILTKTFYELDNFNQTIRQSDKIGIGIEMREDMPLQETVRLINAVIPKMEKSPFDNTIYKLYTVTE